MVWKWRRSFFCLAATCALLVALAGQTLAQAAPAQDASFQPELPLARLASAPQDAVAELYKPDAAQSAEQSCAAQGLAARQRPEERLDATYSEPQAQRQR